mmetsp:Transcript_32415/g.39899  ORF Transcript_32415/g.39899 Transcript_32415/m.39899 type:complete len:559 (+) Transcript_32415:32-1708(+)
MQAIKMFMRLLLVFVVVIRFSNGRSIEYMGDLFFPSFDATNLFNSKDQTRGFLSSVFGDNMVLQRNSEDTIIWGFTGAGANVTAVVTPALAGSHQFSAQADAKGVWRLNLPSIPGSDQEYAFDLHSSSGELASMRNVLFGDVYICGGQSNMQFMMKQENNAPAEIKLADKYPFIRLFTVGQKTRSSRALDDLQTIEQKWSVATSKSVIRFSAVCWFFGKQIADSKIEKVSNLPIGLVSNNWGGTSDKRWSTKQSLDSCHVAPPNDKDSDGNGDLYNAMIHPYTIGPMAITGFTWYQGEADVLDPDLYKCTFPAMIQAWRKAFNASNAYFGFIQLSTWCGVPSIPFQREAQMSALKLPKVGYATNADYGAGCNIHPGKKMFCGKRLANSALALIYGKNIRWKSPTYLSVTQADVTIIQGDSSKFLATFNVRVALQDVSSEGLVNVYPHNYEVPNGPFDCMSNGKQNCAWGSLYFQDKDPINATVYPNGSDLVLEATGSFAHFEDVNNLNIVATSYAFGPVPIMNAYDEATRLPVLPWYAKVEANLKIKINPESRLEYYY